MTCLSKQQILATTPRLKEIDVPEWGGSLFIRPLTIHEQAKLADLGTKYEKSSVVDRMKNCTLRLVQWSVCDEQGNSLFEAADLEPLMSKAASAFLRLQDAILALSGLTEESRKELEKNLLSAPSDGLDSD
jgi:hypothetical protein